MKRDEVKLIPWDELKSSNRAGGEPSGERICVAPTIEQCIVAIPYDLYWNVAIYRTKSPVKAAKAVGIFDACVTQEGWIQKPTTFVKMGTLDFEIVAKNVKLESVMMEGASSNSVSKQRRVLRWWRNANIKRFIKRT